MRSLKLKSGDFISTTCYHRYGLVDSRTNAKMGKHELEDGTIIEVDINGRILKADHASWEPLRVLEMSHIEMKMKSTVPASKQKTLPDPEKVFTSKQAAEFQTRSREAEREKRLERIKRGQPPVHKKRQHLPPGC